MSHSAVAEVLVIGVIASVAACAPAKLAPAPVSLSGAAPDGTITMSMSCGEFLEPPAFAGRVLGRWSDGSTTPLQSVTFIRAIGEAAITDGRSWITGIGTNSAGYFDAAVSIGTSSSTVTEGGRVLKLEDWVEDVVYELRAPGCEPLVVHYSMEWTPRDLLLTCTKGAPESGTRLPNSTLHPTAGAGVGVE